MTDWVPLKRVAQLRYGDALPAESRRDGDAPVFGSGGIGGCHDVMNTHSPAIVVGRKGSYGSVHWARNGAFVIDTAYAIDCRSTRADLRWLYYVLQAADLKGPSQDVGVPGLSRDVAHNILVPPPPPIDEQRRIADFLDAETSRLEGLIRNLTRLRAVLLERRAVAIHSFVTGVGQGQEMRPSGLPWVTVLPAHWQVVRLSLLAVMGSGHTPSRSHLEWWENCTIPWITTGEVSQVRDDRREVIADTREKISLVGMANSAAELHPAGTVVLCRTASAGYSAVMGTGMATSQDFVTWTCGPKLNPYYLLWCLRAMRPDLLGRLAMGSTHKTIYVPDLQMLRVPLPPLNEQQDIVERVRQSNARIDACVDTINHQLDLLSERRQALITAAFTGQIDVTTARGVDV